LGINGYYIDKKCDEIKAILKKNPEYADYNVGRQHWGDDWDLDPYVIQDESKAELMILAPDEVNALDDSELLAYIDVQMKRLDCSENYALFLLATLVLTPVAAINSLMVIAYQSTIDITRALATTFVLVFLTLLSGVMYYTRRKTMRTNRRQIDLEVAGENSIFLSALQKLAALSDNSEWKDQENRKRLQYIENRLESM